MVVNYNGEEKVKLQLMNGSQCGTHTRPGVSDAPNPAACPHTPSGVAEVTY